MKDVKDRLVLSLCGCSRNIETLTWFSLSERHELFQEHETEEREDETRSGLRQHRSTILGASSQQ